MNRLACPTCFHKFELADSESNSIIPCPKCGLSMNIDSCVLPHEPIPKSTLKTDLGTGLKRNSDSILITIPILMLASFAVWVTVNIWRDPTPTKPILTNNQPYTTTLDQKRWESSSDDPLTHYVKEQVEEHWRPGGNSKEDAVILTRDILGARTQEELEAVYWKSIREGR